jgi:hypothetical protein
MESKRGEAVDVARVAGGRCRKSPFFKGGKDKSNSPLIPPYQGGKQIGLRHGYNGVHRHPLPLVKGELERDFGWGRAINGLSRRCYEGGRVGRDINEGKD